MICVTKVAKSALNNALAEFGEDMSDTTSSSEQPIVTEPLVDLNRPLVNETYQNQDDNQQQ